MPPIPPMPSLDAQWVWPLAAMSAALGGLMIAWGNKYHRALVAMLAAGYGILVGPMVASTLGLPLLAGQIAVPMILAVAGIIAAQIVWALLTVKIALLVAAWALVCTLPGALGDTVPVVLTEGLRGWGEVVSGCLVSGLTEAWDSHGLVIVLTLFAAGAVPMVLWFFLPKLAVIAVTSALGAVAVVLGVLLGAAQIDAEWWGGILARPAVLVAAIGAMMTFGMICQYRQETGKRYEEEDDDDDEENDRDTGRPRAKKGGKKKKSGKKKAKRGD